MALKTGRTVRWTNNLISKTTQRRLQSDASQLATEDTPRCMTEVMLAADRTVKRLFMVVSFLFNHRFGTPADAV